MEPEAPKQLPTLVRILGLLLYLGGLVAIIRAIIFITNPALRALPPYVKMSVPGSLIVGAVVNMILARGLLRGRNWARILVCVGYGLGTILAIARGIQLQSMGAIVAGLVSFLIFYYLLTNKSVRLAFKK